MNDNEIIKALECCGEENVHFCSICPIYLHDKDNDFCQEDLHRMSLNLINRQKAEIESLKSELNKNKPQTGSVAQNILHGSPGAASRYL